MKIGITIFMTIWEHFRAGCLQPILWRPYCWEIGFCFHFFFLFWSIIFKKLTKKSRQKKNWLQPKKLIQLKLFKHKKQKNKLTLLLLKSYSAFPKSNKFSKILTRPKIFKYLKKINLNTIASPHFKTLNKIKEAETRHPKYPKANLYPKIILLSKELNGTLRPCTLKLKMKSPKLSPIITLKKYQ